MDTAHEDSCHPDCSQPGHLWPYAFDAFGQLISEQQKPYRGDMVMEAKILAVMATVEGREKMYKALGIGAVSSDTAERREPHGGIGH